MSNIFLDEKTASPLGNVVKDLKEKIIEGEVVSVEKRIVDQSNFVFDGGVLLPDEDIVDREGYRDTETQVREMINAGERLREFRREEFDDFEDGDVTIVNPTRAQGFDIIDADLLVKQETERLNKLAEEIKKKQEEKKVEEKEGKTDA